MVRIITVNLNGIRSAAAKGFFDWLSAQAADIVCVQETKAHDHQVPPEAMQVDDLIPYFHHAQRKGYAGVGLYSRVKPDKVIKGLGWDDFDQEGRFIQADFGKLSVVSIYLPSGSSGEERQQAKFDFLERFRPVLRAMRRKQREYILCGDWNIAHKQIDIKNWRSNQKNSGFLPEERAWMDELFGTMGFIDGFRQINQDPDQYTWWSNRGRAREKNVGWRIDYQVLTPGLKDKVLAASIYKEKWFSDHAPLVMDYGLDLNAAG